MTRTPFAGKVAAVIGHGDDMHRAVAVALAEAGADVALGTTERSQAEEYGANSIANEIWAVGREHFVREMDGSDAAEVHAFAAEVWDRLGPCGLLVTAHDRPSARGVDELSHEAWDTALNVNLTQPFWAIQAFGTLMEREGSGQIAVLASVTNDADAAYSAARAGLRSAAQSAATTWAPKGVGVVVLDGGSPAEVAKAVLAIRV